MDKLNVLFFKASWCLPCKTLEPIIETVCKELNIKLTKFNVESSPDIANQLSIMNIPTIIIISNEVEVGRIIGATSKNKLLTKIKSLQENYDNKHQE